MKGLYLQNSKYHKENNTGIYKKIIAQIEAIKSSNIECIEIIQDDGRNKSGKAAAVIHRLPFTNTTPKWEILPEFSEVDFIYFRRPSVMTMAMRRTLRAIRERNSKVKIVMELPTYPYDHELSGIGNITLLWKDRYNRKRLKGLIDRILVIDPTLRIKDIWGIPSIPFLNGIDVEAMPLRVPNKHEGIHIICVAIFSKWHGYERIFEGMHDYYANGGEVNIIVDMVGEGPEQKYYMDLVKNLNLQGMVIFHGKKSGQELNDLFDNADIGAIGLNWYKYGYSIIGDLKSREYLSRGLPVLSAGTLDVELNEKTPYIYDAEASDSPIDINRLVAFYYDVYSYGKPHEIIAPEIREYAKRNVDMKIVMKNFIKYIQGED